MKRGIKKWLPFKRGERRGHEPAPAPREATGLTRLQHDVNRLFDRFFDEPFGALARPGETDSWFGDFSPTRFTPTIDLADEKNHLKVTAELPGMEVDDVELDVRDDVLRIRGEKRTEETSEEDGYYRTERSFGMFERAIPLPEEVDADRAEATFKKGVLTVRLPKAESGRSGRRIEIRGG